MVSKRVKFNSIAISIGCVIFALSYFTYFSDNFLILLFGVFGGSFIGSILCGLLFYRKDLKIILLCFPFVLLGLSVLMFAIIEQDLLTDVFSHAPWIFGGIPILAVLGSIIGFGLNPIRLKKEDIKI